MFSALFFLVAISAVFADPTGSPPEACEDRNPGHGNPPQVGQPPYRYIIEHLSEELYHVIITVEDEETPFIGFMIHALDEFDAPVGYFEPLDENSGVMDCFAEADTLVHNHPQARTGIEFNYYLPEGSDGSGVKFTGTIMLNFATYWNNFISEDLGEIRRLE